MVDCGYGLVNDGCVVWWCLWLWFGLVVVVFDLVVELLVLMVEFSVWLVGGFLDICGCCGCSIGW